ncbi:MAG: indole-3-glycerol phosphate synthase [Candidatus Hydrogenedentota bacterium]
MILDDICAHKLEEVAARKQALPQRQLEEQIDWNRKPRDFRGALRKDGISLIAEIKRSSPVKGTFLHNVDPVELGHLYQDNGARAISILTDEKYFKGTLQDLRQVSTSVRVPCLRKEFIVDEYQIYEARANRADAILLIVRMLTDEQIKDYSKLAATLGMGVLVETHDEEEIARALKAGSAIIGINNRDLSSFTVDIGLTLRLKKLVPGGHVLVSESGIYTRDDVKRLEDGGVDAILVGEAIVSNKDIASKIRELLGFDQS